MKKWQPKIRISLSALLFALLAGLIGFNLHPVNAVPNVGPDSDDVSPSNFYGQSYGSGIPRSYMYAVANSDFAQIITSRIKVYMPAPNGTITIQSPHMCTKRTLVNSSPYPYFRSNDKIYSTSTGDVSRYRVTNTGGIGSSQYGQWNGSITCEDATLTFNVSGSTRDTNTGMYPYFVEVTALANGEYTNTYGVVGPAGSYVGQDAAQSSQSFGMRMTSPIPQPPDPSRSQTTDPPHPYKNYTTLQLPFGTDCTVTTPTIRNYVELYDDDNFSDSAQLRPFWVQMREYDRNTKAFLGTISPTGVQWTNTSGGWGPTYGSPNTTGSGGWVRQTYNGQSYDYVYTTGSGQSLRSYYEFRRDRVYRLVLFNAFYANTLQFKLPYEGIYYYVPCQQAQATLQPSSTVDKPQISYPETATFQHFLNVSNFNSNGSVNYSIQRYRNGTPVGGPQNGTMNFNVNGQSLIATRPYTSSAADLGARICEQLTLSGPGNITNNPSESCTTVIARPFITATNNDIWAGSWFDHADNECTGLGPRNSKVLSWLNSGAGAVSEYGLFALGAITEFGSGRQPGGNALTFANTPNSGSYGAPPRCVPNYYSIIGTGGAQGWNGINAIPGNAGKRKYFVNGNVTINGGTIPPGTQAVLLVNGNITINGNINYANFYGSGPSISNLWIVARGNIYIRENVSDLSGFYVAQGTASAPGRLHTCVRPGQTSTYNPLSINVCNNQLNIYGAILADKVFWQRTHGTAAPAQQYAESIQFDPGLWINSPIGSSGAGSSRTEDVKELPPIY